MSTSSPLPAPKDNDLSRRGFLVTMMGGLSIGFFLPGSERLAQAATGAAPTTAALNANVHISTDGTITLRFGGCEMGQGSMSGHAQLLAEELGVEWHQVLVQQADATQGLSYTTGGSSAISRRFIPIRTAGATARELLVAAAMLATGDRNRARYQAERALVSYTDPDTGAVQTWGYGDLAVAAASAEALALLPSPIPLTAPADFRIIGKPVPRPDIPLKTDGSAKYGLDVFIPGMVFAVVRHGPIGATLAATPAKPSGAIALVPCKAQDTRGAVVAGTYNAVAVVADNTWKAKKLATGLSVKWTLPASTASVDSAAILQQARDLLDSGTPMVAEPLNTGLDAGTLEAAVEEALATQATRVVEAEFTLPYLAHATMEVLNCSVNITFTNGVPTFCEVWAPNQAALSVQRTAATLTGLPTSQIVVHTTFLGGGLGRKIEQDYPSQAIQVALAVKRPVKLTWMREQDFGFDQYRPLAVIRAKAGLNAANDIVGWFYRNVSQSISHQRGRSGLDSQAVEGSVRLPYAKGTSVVEWVPLLAGIPVGYWRSVGSSIHAFAVESLIDMLAQEAGLDPFDFRYQVTTDERARGVLAAADALSSWRRSLKSGRAWGVALAESFGTVVCEVVEISQPSSSSIKVHRVACVVDCGTVVNPDSVEAQMQGGIVHGLSAVLWGQVTFSKGVAAQTNFNRYRMLRLSEMPEITVQTIPSNNAPSGIGEPGVPPIAPAIANAYARLTGIRVTQLPLFPGATMGGL